MLLPSLIFTAAAILAPGYAALDFPAPTPGTYELPSLWAAADGPVLRSDGKVEPLHAQLGDKAVIMSFVYTSCGDVNGCPLATFVLSQLQAPIQNDPELHDRVRLVTLSFDPEHDTPDVMKKYGRSFREPDFDWRFLTTESTQALAPLLDRYDQSLLRAEGEKGRVISHILRVYLIDTDKQIRNVYNTSFLHRDTILADLRTVLELDSAEPHGSQLEP